MPEYLGRPEWAPENAGSEFACRVMGGVHESHDGMVFTPSPSTGPAPKRKQLTVQDYIDGVLSCDRTVLSRAITLVEITPANSSGNRVSTVIFTAAPQSHGS